MYKYVMMASVAALGLAVAASRAMAQVPLPVPKASFGVIGGLNIAKLGGDDVSDGDVGNRTGFNGGVFVTLHLTNTIAIEPEVMYSQQGSKTTDQGVDETIKLDYIQIPVLFRLDLPSASAPIHPFFIAGPSAGIQTKCEFAASSGGASASFTCDEVGAELGESLNKSSFDFAAVGGAGVSFGLGGKSLSVSARYTYGFKDTFKDSSIKNRYFSILAGLTF